MGTTLSTLFCGESDPEVSVEHGDSVTSVKAIHTALTASLAAAAGDRNDELQASPTSLNPTTQNASNL